MSETMIDANGYWFGSTSSSLSQQIFIYRNPEIEDNEKIKISVLINPKIQNISDETEDDWEGCFLYLVCQDW